MRMLKEAEEGQVKQVKAMIMYCAVMESIFYRLLVT